jgi:hypothetical protein
MSCNARLYTRVNAAKLVNHTSSRADIGDVPITMHNHHSAGERHPQDRRPSRIAVGGRAPPSIDEGH